MKHLNHNGQVLVCFVLLIPLILVFIGYFLEKGNLAYQETKIDNILNLACKTTEKKELILKNDPTLDVEISPDQKTIQIHKKVKSLISGIIGFQTFDIKVQKTCEE